MAKLLLKRLAPRRRARHTAGMTSDPTIAQAREQYHELGFAGPFTAFAADDMRRPAAEVADLMARDRIQTPAKRNRHLDWDPIAALIDAHAMRTVAESILGPRLVLWRTQLFGTRYGRGLPWHRDGYLTLLADPARQLSLHLALTAATADNCVMLVPGSHRMDDAALRQLGFRFAEGSDGGRYGAPTYWREPGTTETFVPMLLKPGEFFAFHPGLLHASRDARSADDLGPVRQSVDVPPGGTGLRLGLALRLAPADNAVSDDAFVETAPRVDRSVPF